MSKRSKEVLEGLERDENRWVDELSREIRDAMLGPDQAEEAVPSEIRVKVLALLEERCRPVADRQAKTVWKLLLQRRALAFAGILLMGVIGVGVYRLNHVEGKALARSWRMFNERQIIAMKTGSAAAEKGMIWVTERLKEIDAEPGGTPEDHATRKRNVIMIGNQVLTQRSICLANEKKLRAVDFPDRIDRFTYVRDPFTGRTLALNATVDGRISDKDVDDYLRSDGVLMGLLAAAKTYSQPGAEPLPPFLFDHTDVADRERILPAKLQEDLKKTARELSRK